MNNNPDNCRCGHAATVKHDAKPGGHHSVRIYCEHCRVTTVLVSSRNEAAARQWAVSDWNNNIDIVRYD